MFRTILSVQAFHTHLFPQILEPKKSINDMEITVAEDIFNQQNKVRKLTQDTRESIEGILSEE